MQNNSVKISVIVPVYNVEKYLPKAIESILNQSFKDFELFLVDDGSKDNSGKICDKYSLVDNRIKVIHQNNSGAYSARNNALNVAIGEYVCFFDSDDYIDINMLSDLYSLAKQYDSNLIVSGFYIDTYYNSKDFIVLNYIPNTSNNSEVENIQNIDDFRKTAYLNFDRNMFYPPWNKLYKLSYIKDNNIKFPITYRDDFPFVLNVIKDIDRVTYTTKQYYHFVRKRSDSETQKYVENLYEKREEEHEELLSIYRYWNLLKDKNSFDMISRRYIDRIIECMVNLFNSECKLTKNEKKTLISKFLNTNNFKDCVNNAIPKKIYLKLLYIILKSKNVNLCYLMSRFINFIKKKNVKLFSVLKKNR